jgi:glutamate racemase
MSNEKRQPIGIFDSGVGGLTVAHAIKTVLPGEQIIYFGDTFHLPYGDKSSESVKYYSTRITDFLLEKECKIILIACNTASASAYEEVKEHASGKAMVFNVIDPVVEHIAGSSEKGTVGVIGTKGTIKSGTYQRKLQQANANLEVKSLATPLLVPMIEEGFIFDDISNAIIRTYLSGNDIGQPGILILGCTHYPIIKRQIEKFYNFETKVIDSGNIVASAVKKYLQEQNLMNDTASPPAAGRGDNRQTQPGMHSFFVSDYTDYFEKIAKIFFEENLSLEELNIWV